jgi:hypothetical protein
MTEYRKSVWRNALNDAERDVMRATATPNGGRLEGEDLMAYVGRAKQIQDAAIIRWMTAKAELQATERETWPPFAVRPMMEK